MTIGETSDETRRWLEDTAEVLSQRSVFWGSTDGWSGTPDSQAVWELEAAKSAGWGDPPPPGLVQAALLDWWDVATGHVGSLETLVRAGDVMFSIPYLVRGILEPCHKISWVLEAQQLKDGSLSPVSMKERAARVHLEELYSLKHRRDVVKKLDGKAGDPFKVCDADLTEFRDVTLPGLFTVEELSSTKPSAWRVEGERWRGPTSLAEWYAKKKMVGPGQNGTYDALSAMSHPTLYGQREFVEYEPVDGGTVRRRSVSTDFLGRVIGGGISTYWRACRDLASYFGWPAQPLDDWAAELNRWRDGLIG